MMCWKNYDLANMKKLRGNGRDLDDIKFLQGSDES